MEELSMIPMCWVIVDKCGSHPSIAAQFARHLGLSIEFRPIDDNRWPPITPGRRVLIAIDYRQLEELGLSELRTLRSWVEAGTTLYVGGAAQGQTNLSLEPFAPLSLEVAQDDSATEYHVRPHCLAPAALRGETEVGNFQIPGVDAAEGAIEPVLVARYDDGAERTAVFVVRCGSGVAIYNLLADDATFPGPIVDRLADPWLRAGSLGALIAANRAAGRDPDRVIRFNLTLDDRPANLDFFNVANVIRLLRRMRERVPNAHVDFAWTPNQTRPSRRYLKALRDFDAGFVWHGFLRHVDHRRIQNPEADLEQGRRLVELLSRRFGVRFQPIMVFPFQRDTPRCVELLRRHGFRAKSESLPVFRDGTREQSSRDDYSSLAQRPEQSGFTVLHRKALHRIDRGWMLAMAAVGMPILAVAHPGDFALKRFARNPWHRDLYAELDELLQFAAEKSLRPASLMEVADDVIAHANVTDAVESAVA
jgi:hypothetical protein